MEPELHEELTTFRRLLHRKPELSCEEHATAERVVAFAKRFEPDETVTGLGGTGVALIYGEKQTGKTVLLRCELDALPIEEINTFDHRSEQQHVSHKCGHDGHMTIMLAVAAHFQHHPPTKGRVVLLFQPAEENGFGAKAIMEDAAFDALHPDHVLALHNLPGYPLHRIVCRKGSFTASVRSIIITLHGKTSHAGEPDKGINPALAIAEILQETHALQVSRDQEGFKQVTPIQVEMGEEAYGISAGFGEVKLTIRTWTNDAMDELADDCERLANETGIKYGLRVEIGWTQFFDANQNDPEMVGIIRGCANELGLEYEERREPFRWGEDFGRFTKVFQGAMFGLGSGEDTPALHNPDYDFPDELIPTGAKMFVCVADKLLQG